MTYFLDGPEEIVPPKVDQPDAGIPSFLEGLGAAFNSAQIENDSNFRMKRESNRVVRERAAEAKLRLDEGEIDAELKRRGIYARTRTIDEIIEHDPQAAAVVLEMARNAALQDPEAWQDINITDGEIEREVNERVRKEWDEAQDILNMMPGGRGAAEFLGGMAGITADAKNVPFLLMGGPGGSFLRVMAREALINVTAEAAFLPSQFDVAERIDIADPDIPAQLAMAAGAGAIFGAIFEGVGRGLQYAQGRDTAPRIPGYTEAESRAAVDAVEDALLEGRDVNTALKAVEPTQAEPVALPNAVRSEIAEQSIGARGADEGLAVLNQTAPIRFDEASLPRTDTAITAGGGFRAGPLNADTAIESNARYQIARAENPQAFTRLEESEKRAATYRRWLNDLQDQQDAEVRDILARIDAREAELLDQLGSMKTGGRRKVRDELKQLKTAREEAMTLSGQRETPDMQRVRKALMDEDAKQRDLAPEIGRAYRETAQEADQAVLDIRASRQAPQPVTEPVSALEVPSTPRAAETPTPATRPSSAATDAPAQVNEVLSDPASREAREYHEAVEADLRDRIEADGDIEVNLGEGPRSMRAALDELDEDDAFLEALNLCGVSRDVT